MKKLQHCHPVSLCILASPTPPRGVVAAYAISSLQRPAQVLPLSHSGCVVPL